jgi:hypothetical protein
MNRRMGMIVLILGVAVIAFTFVDPTGMGNTPTAGAEGIGWAGSLGVWPPLRIGILSAGALLGILGAYGVAKKQPEAKK